MKNRKQVLIDKKFQLSKSFSVIGIVFVIITAIIIFMGIFIMSNNQKLELKNADMKNSIDDIRQIMDLQQKVFIALSSRALSDNEEVNANEASQLNADYNSSIIKLMNAIKNNESIVVSNVDIMERNNWLIVIVITCLFVGVLVLCFLMIRFTHRISGPIWVMSKHLKEVLNGQTPTMHDLREKDEFKEFYDLFRQVVSGHLKVPEPKSTSEE